MVTSGDPVAFPTLEPGQEFSSPAIHLSLARMLAFSGGPFDAPGWPKKNLHTDVEKAAEAGFRAPIASSIQAEGQAVRVLESVFGEAWFSGGVLDLKLVRPLFVGDSFVIRVVVRERSSDDGGVRYALDVTGVRTDGEVVVSGSAQVSAPAPALT